jgi:ADP-ribosylglycohydrolase
LFTALLGFNIMSRFQTQEDILKLNGEVDEFVDIPSGTESKDGEETDDER